MGTVSIIALITWIIAAIGGFVMLGVWLRHGAARAAEATVGGGPHAQADGGATPTAKSHLPAPLVYAHFALAVVGLIVWIIYLITSAMALGWIALVLVLIVAIAGFVMFFRWLAQRRSGTAPGEAVTPERHFPTAVVVAHGVFATATVVLVIIVAITVSVG